MDVSDLLEAHLEQRTPQGLATALSRLIHTGALPTGTRLPTVRVVAQRLRLSPTMVSEAWTILVRTGVIRTEGRRGTFVIGIHLEPAPPRFWEASREVGRFSVDLGTGTPDTDLLPDLRPALTRLAATATVSNYLEPAMLPDLERELRASWDGVFDPEAVTIVDGALDGLDRACRELVRYGDQVVVEDPALPTIFDVVEANGGRPVGVPVDEEGLVPAALEAALEADPVAVVLQPRAQNPTGVSMSTTRAEELAALLEGRRAMVIEDDHCGPVAWAPLATLGRWLPQRTVHITSFSKSHGPDLRLAAVAGPLPFIQKLAVRRRLGPSWSSRLLQSLLVELLADPETAAAVADARLAYHQRRRALVDHLAALGVAVGGSDGFNLWIPVAAEEGARKVLRAHGIGVRPGRPFQLDPGRGPHVRMTCSTLATDAAELAAVVATAAGATGRPVDTNPPAAAPGPANKLFMWAGPPGAEP